MQNNYFFLRALCHELNQRISQYTVVSCFSQSKDELVIELNNGLNSFFIRADFSPSSNCLSFPKTFKRANKNSVDLFPELIFKKVIEVLSFRHERTFEIKLENSISLLFKLHGKFSNVLFCHAGVVNYIFKNTLKNDFSLDVNNLNREVDWSKEFFEKNITHLKEAYPILGKEPWFYLTSKRFESASKAEKWNLWEAMHSHLLKPHFYIIRLESRMYFSLLPFGEIVREFTDPIEAITEFYFKSVSSNYFESIKAQTLSELQKKIKSTENFIQKNKAKLEEIENDHHYQTWGDLLMAHLHEIKSGKIKVTLNDFYSNQPVEIKLKPELSAQKNAEIFYRKSKNHQIEINKLRESITNKEGELLKHLELKGQLLQNEDLKSIQSVASSIHRKDKEKDNIKRLPYHEFEFKGYKIWVGKNAEANDDLTLKHSYKEDLWLHAKDVAGSHVLVKHQAGRNYPKDVIEYAASLAAYYSKRKTESLCPVSFTPKKFVRKRKGDPAGLVVVEKEEVILVEPKEK